MEDGMIFPGREVWESCLGRNCGSRRELSSHIGLRAVFLSALHPTLLASHILSKALGADTKKTEGSALDAFLGAPLGTLSSPCWLGGLCPMPLILLPRKSLSQVMTSPVFGICMLLEKLVSPIKAVFSGHHGKRNETPNYEVDLD